MTESSKFLSLPYDVAKDLIETKQNLIRVGIQELLEKWDQTDSQEFIESAKTGALEEAEHDALLMTNLLYELKELEKLLS